MSSLAINPDYYSPKEYLSLERKSQQKNEYLNGKIVAMSGASRNHNLIAGNIYHELRLKLIENPCELFISDMRVKVSPTCLYTYPDLSVACDEIKFDDQQNNTLLNPQAIFEVLSSSTETYDRGNKFAHYRKLPSLKHYILVSQEKILIEHYIRQGKQWLLSEFDNINETIHFSSLDCSLSLKEIYHRVNLINS